MIISIHVFSTPKNRLCGCSFWRGGATRVIKHFIFFNHAGRLSGCGSVIISTFTGRLYGSGAGLIWIKENKASFGRAASPSAPAPLKARNRPSSSPPSPSPRAAPWATCRRVVGRGQTSCHCRRCLCPQLQSYGVGRWPKVLPPTRRDVKLGC
jgi:hypothetical protein